MLLAYDFGTYLTHRLSHAVPFLWSFQVHHSAETLNPLTFFASIRLRRLFGLD